MAEQSPAMASPQHRPRWWMQNSPARSYGLVLILVVLDYFLVSAFSTYSWGTVIVEMVLGFTLLIVLYVARSRRVWLMLTGIYIIAISVLSVVTALVPGMRDVPALAGGLLLIVAPVVILRHVLRDKVVTVETILGATSVYLLLGFSFASIYATIDSLVPSPFFEGSSQASANDYLFFSYTTLTTVGYGNLVPASILGRTFAMVEALIGQIYLVIVIARLVALWGQNLPPRPPGKRDSLQAEESERDADASTHLLVRTASPSGTV